ncbi:receptor-like protein 4 isoform X2 [Rhodamnia argentea]|uniref:Receptor-like protein 4 isoform X2 n=1 Tax=Rhodamnia argentea TaxID=178133 RepID=A0ABM3HK39_9MYRT|nr:receptor-like protein 4 isoform X2 [Rhodamnia argentea]
MSLLSFLLLLLLLPLASSSSSSFPHGNRSSLPHFSTGNVSFHIDCGSATDSTDPFNTTWLSDRFFTGGSSSVVSEPLRFRFPPEKTLRFFPPLSSGKKNCYVLPDLPSGRYYLRTFTVYDDYDGKSRPPSFDTSVQGTLVFSWRSPWPEDVARLGAYSDLLAFVPDRQAEICFYSIATDSPVIGSLSLIQVDPLSYDAASIGDGFILVNYGRLDCGSGQWGPGFSNDTDYFGRSWQSDYDFRSPDSRNNVEVISTNSTISGANQQPNYFPMKLYQTAIMAREGSLDYALEVDAKMDYLLWLHFAEIESKTSGAGQRVFDVVVNGDNLTRVDIYKEVGLFAAYDWHYTLKNLSSTTLSVKLEPVVGVPLISGLENYALVPVDLSTDPEQVAAMRALKESLGVPERMGWNGDPCAPTSWDAWEGVTCHPNKDKTSLIIYQIDLGSQGLKGYISDQINLLSNLVSLNLSSNFLRGTVPSGLGENALARLDLSGNQLTGSIPDSLASSNMQLVLLNDNLLEGKVPEGLYSIGVHGGSIEYLRLGLGLGPMEWEMGCERSVHGKIVHASTMADLDQV